MFDSVGLECLVYQDVLLHIDGQWRAGSSRLSEAVVNPANGEEIGKVAVATVEDLEEAAQSSHKGFTTWKRMSAFDRSQKLRRAADLLRERVEQIAEILTLEQGKPLAEARAEVRGSAEVLEWFAEEGRRAYGRIIPSRSGKLNQSVIREPLGPVIAFTPWNFPINQAVRKVGAALAAGCSIILKAPSETPGAPAELVRALADAGLPDGVITLVCGDPEQISSYLIPHPLIAKLSYTGSTRVGKLLAALAGQHMKRATMELGGHAPAIVFNDADVTSAVKRISAAKFMNAGQVCIAPTRIFVQDGVYDEFTSKAGKFAEAITVGDGRQAGVTMGPLAHANRVKAMEDLVEDAVANGARVETGGRRVGNSGFFFAPTLLADLPDSAKAMNEEPFGPIMLVNRFASNDEAMAAANRLSYGLAAYAFTRDVATSAWVASELAAGMVALNHTGLGLPETPFGGIKDSGYGSEGGSEALDSYLTPKLISSATA